MVSTAPGVSDGFVYTYAGPAFVLDGASNTVCVLGVFAGAACARGGMVPCATSAEVAFDARAACASLIACCATAVALSRIDCGSEAFELALSPQGMEIGYAESRPSAGIMRRATQWNTGHSASCLTN